MITFITGVPGSGKTLYCIDKLVSGLVGTTAKGEKDGVSHEYPRTVYTNINGLLIEHELIDGNGDWKLNPDKRWSFSGYGGGLRDWHLWAKPGSVIVFDEVQKVWKPRPAGSPCPPDIEALETHRHMGIDFIFLTQHALLVDRNLLAFVARHLHMRRVGNMNLAICYEWDHCSKSLLYKNSIAKSPYRYNKSVFKLYKSAELHTKQPRKMPALLWFIAIGLLVFSIGAPAFVSRIHERVAPSKLVETPVKKIGQSPQNQTIVKTETKVAVSADNKAITIKPTYKGCISTTSRCQCFDLAGLAVQLPIEQCREAVVQIGLSIPIFDLTCPRLPYQSKFQKSGTARLTDPCTCIGFTVLL